MSGKSVAQKLGLKPGTALWVSHPERSGLLGPLPEGVGSAEALQDAGAAVLFTDDAAGIRALIEQQGDALRAPALLWVAYPKGNRADINRDSLWPILAERAMRPIGQVALDEIWSALRFRPLADGEAPFTGGR